MAEEHPRPRRGPPHLKRASQCERLREAYGLTYFDSLHASSALHHDGAIISVDEDYRRVPMLKVMDPREL
ncbi:MAG: hypothetical protein DRJ96_03965 [Thermoprotei archaeon]|nr:MAG: hypothetical protein DRJ96_03965 [Thermoprotei archaeon]